ncbi:hypothetical protein J2751_002742 [Halorubrum alkaliphilum]|uniref:DUF7718 domain-containing protein n=1 Tax=Halorubrum alkaliphilum TaxID=261290 RepID=A0A8T4GJ33_9EURY|nr:hypothetical protein [Halorubrum alkaliphilum]MBP1923697.1 hypothetical protein [Halorubrum alkaliphilum]
MSAPSLPIGYDVSKHVPAGRRDCLLTVGFDQHQQHIPRFLVQLHYRVAIDPIEWTAIARMDHNETSSLGHDVYREGLHVDVARRSQPTVHLQLAHAPLPISRGAVIRGCANYLKREAEYFIDVFEERRSPGRPPSWSDGGEPTPTFIPSHRVEGDMSREAPADADMVSDEELTELLADAEGTAPETIERGAAELEIAPPEEATVVDVDE